MHDALERAYALGDHQTAVKLATRIVSSLAGPTAHVDDVELESQSVCVERARAVLIETRPDRFLSIIGALGLGLTAWLVYNYVL
jgi:hypothetical protein